MARRKKKAEPTLETATAPRKASRSARSTWKLMDRGSVVVGALLARRLSTGAWRVVTGKPAPTNSRSPEVATREAVVWAVVGGALVELVRMGTRRAAATYWVKSTGDLPPGMKRVRPGK
ncbi:DUF4235 domain-containing protein [Aeromicrobium sp. IC_218]|uniref:DUF4235 domain-containing protein n=1 Tax=Aeromicrobium sp. IC_218 TaxID=2545468 RepID=UPI00103D169F|nr:DUF4235 domain-containing protein [Aeromicrobium sp. IC_218]TCJ00118.1 DUF4235 domain-containing protein [Aeromicrobium sp. IC_218]